MQRLTKESLIRTFLDARIEEAKAKLKAESLEQGREQGLEQGREQGLEQGIEQGITRERELLQGLAERRFGAETADRLAECLAQVREHDRLMAIGGWLVDCASGTELLDRVEGRA